MPAHEKYVADQGEAQSGASSLLSLIGQSKHVTGGFPIFAIKSMLVSFSSATVSKGAALTRVPWQGFHAGFALAVHATGCRTPAHAGCQQRVTSIPVLQVFGCASYMLLHGPLGPALSFLVRERGAGGL